MGEKLYRSLTMSGAGSIAVGVVVVVTGLAAGIIAIINGAHTLANRKNITF
ncbi:MAG: hypothetical protein J5757_02525 [Lachnospiraceae bacterium]|nr:hypothetical protein [Lachnospiraceae bacterium]